MQAKTPKTKTRTGTAAAKKRAGATASTKPKSARAARVKPPAAAPTATAGESPPKRRRSAAAKASTPAALRVALAALEDMKAVDVKALDVRGMTDVSDYMVIASGTSDRHVRSMAQRVVEKAKEAGYRPHGVEGQQDGNWVLIDLSDVIVHVMLPKAREFYALEKLWDLSEAQRTARP